MVSSVGTLKKSCLICVHRSQVSRNYLFFGGELGGWGIHISQAAILEGLHLSLVICVRVYTYHGGTHITATPVFNYRPLSMKSRLCVVIVYKQG